MEDSDARSPGAIFIDTNVLVYLRQKQSPFHEAARQRLNDFEETGVERWISRQIIRECLAAMTRVADISVVSLLDDVRRFQARFGVVGQGAPVTQRLLWLLERVEVGGKQVHDANIVATMLEGGVRHLLTHNVKDFERFEEYVTVLPLVSEG